MRRSALLLGLALWSGCAGVTADDDPEDYTDPPVPEDAELPDGADAPLLPPNEGEKDDVIETVDDAVVATDAPAIATDVPSIATDVP